MTTPETQKPLVLPVGIRLDLRSPIWMSTVTTDDGRPLHANGIKVEADFAPGAYDGLKITLQIPIFDEKHGHAVQTIEGVLVEPNDFAAFMKWKRDHIA